VCTNWRVDVRRMSDINFCVLNGSSPKKIMFLGDSHTQQLYPLVEREYKTGELGDRGVLFAVENGCLPLEHLNSTDSRYHCDRFAGLAMQRAEAPDIDSVFIAFNARWSVNGGGGCFSENWVCTRELSPDELRSQVMEQLGAQIRELRAHGKRVIVSLPFPLYDKSIPDVEIRNAVLSRYGLGLRASDLISSSVRDQVADVALRAGGEVFDPRISLCKPAGCITELDGVSIYKDNNHIAGSQIFLLEDNLKRALTAPDVSAKQGASVASAVHPTAPLRSAKTRRG
jgi:hypothetical protein